MHNANRGKCQLIASNLRFLLTLTERDGFFFFSPHLDASPTKPRARTPAQVCVAAKERADARHKHKHAQVAVFVEKTCLLVLLALTSPTFCQNRQRDSHQTCCVFLLWKKKCLMIVFTAEQCWHRKTHTHARAHAHKNKFHCSQSLTQNALEKTAMPNWLQGFLRHCNCHAVSLSKPNKPWIVFLFFFVFFAHLRCPRMIWFARRVPSPRHSYAVKT